MQQRLPILQFGSIIVLSVLRTWCAYQMTWQVSSVAEYGGSPSRELWTLTTILPSFWGYKNQKQSKHNMGPELRYQISIIFRFFLFFLYFNSTVLFLTFPDFPISSKKKNLVVNANQKWNFREMGFLDSISTEHSLEDSSSFLNTSTVIALCLFFSLLCACIVIGHLLEENRWANESITALLLVGCLCFNWFFVSGFCEFDSADEL